MQYLLIGVIVLPLMIIFTNKLDEIECKAKAKALNYTCEYGFWTGCVLEKPNGKRILLEQLREFSEEQ